MGRNDKPGKQRTIPEKPGSRQEYWFQISFDKNQLKCKKI